MAKPKDSPVHVADTLAAVGKVDAAVDTLARAAERGDADAAFRLVLWRLGGEPIPRDLPAARIALRRATALGHAEARTMEVALAAHGTGAAPDWRGAVALLTALAEPGSPAADQLALLAAMRLDADGNPLDRPVATPLSTSPRVARCAGLFSAAECRHVALLAHPLLEPAVVADPRTGQMIRHPVRTSHGAVIGPTREDLVVAALNRRIAAVAGIPFDHGEPLAVLAYAPGQEYRPHFDGLPHAGNQRARTVLIYLNDDFAGGETVFTATGLTVRPRTGDAIVFDNTLPDGSLDPRSQYAGLPVTRGTKWLATRWIRQRRYDPWYPS